MENGIRMIALGGLGHIGLNAMVLDTPEGAYLLDCGVEFPDPNEPGVDQVIPDVTWLLGLGEHLKAVILTHGHEDHIGGVAHLLKQRRLPVYGPRLAIALLEEKLDEHGIHGEVQLQIVEKTTTLSLEGISVEFLRVTHSIPDCFSLAIRTAEGTVIHTGDWKWDEEPVDGEEVDIDRFTMLGDEGVALLLGDSTNAEVPGRTRSEKAVGEGLRDAIVGHDGRVIVAMFSSNIHRMHILADLAEETGRHMVLLGRGLERMARVSRRVGLNRTDSSLFITPRNMGLIPPSKLLVCCTGTQGEPFSALYRASLGIHPLLEVQEGDLVLHSARKIPGNEGRIYDMFAQLTRLGAHVVHGKAAPIHASGHATQDELRAMFEWVRPQAFVPVHGETSFLQTHASIAREAGVPEVKVIENGRWFSLRNGQVQVGDEETFRRLYYDGAQSGNSTAMGIKERWKIAHTGVVAIQVTRKTVEGKLQVTVHLQSQGVPDVKGRFEKDCRQFVEQELQRLPSYTPRADFEDAAKMLVRRFAKQSVGKKPAVLLHCTEG